MGRGGGRVYDARLPGLGYLKPVTRVVVDIERVEQVDGEANEHDFDTEQIDICPDADASRQVGSRCPRTTSALAGGISEG